LLHQQFSQLYAFLSVEIEQSHSGATFRRQTLYAPVLSQMKVLRPALPSRMK
jgi:hypothetical protein